MDFTLILGYRWITWSIIWLPIAFFNVSYSSPRFFTVSSDQLENQEYGAKETTVMVLRPTNWN